MYHHEIVDVSGDSLPFKVILHQSDSLSTVIPKHWHRSLEISFTYKGSIESFSINKKNFTTSEGDILIVNQNEVHSVDVQTDTSITALTLIFPFEFMEQEIEDYASRWYLQPKELALTTVQKQSLERCRAYLTTIIQNIQTPSCLNRLALMSNIYPLLFEITAHFSICEDQTSSWQSNRDLAQMRDMINYIDAHFTDDLSVAFLAETFHLSEGYFSRFFKKNMNISVMNYVKEIRLKNAYQLLLNTDLPVNIISDNSGFPNTKSLNHVFKQKYKTTPTQYRLKRKEVSF